MTPVAQKTSDITYTYPLLDKVFSTYSGIHNLNSTYLVACQHLLEPQLEMFKRLIAFGFKPQNILVLGKIYSVNKDIASELRALGIDVRTPAFSGKSFDVEHRENCIGILNSLSANIENVIILDDGAELIKVFAESHRRVLFAVEQTSSGFRKLENTVSDFPIVNVARSAVKLIQESPIIAHICFERIENYIQRSNLKKPLVLVVGLGPIGEAIFEILEQNKFTVEGFDIKHGHSDLISKIKEMQPDIVVGATGSNIITEKDLEFLISNHIFHFVSVSSSDREFPVTSFRKNNGIHADISYKNFIFVNNGFPITFKGNRIESTPIEMEKTMCLLGGSIAYGVVNNISSMKGLVEVPQQLQDMISTSI